MTTSATTATITTVAAAATTSNKKLLETSATLLVTSASLVVTSAFVVVLDLNRPPFSTRHKAQRADETKEHQNSEFGAKNLADYFRIRFDPVQ